MSNGEVRGPARIAAEVGDEVSFSVTSDAADEVHVHTYDVSVRVEVGRSRVVRLRANIPGVFEIELEESHVRLTQLRVTP